MKTEPMSETQIREEIDKLEAVRSAGMLTAKQAKELSKFRAAIKKLARVAGCVAILFLCGCDKKSNYVKDFEIGTNYNVHAHTNK